jgi:Na+-driven multidrug efflux pump
MQTVFISLFLGITGTVLAIGISPALPIFLRVDPSIHQSFLQYYYISYSTLLLFTTGAMFSAVFVLTQQLSLGLSVIWICMVADNACRAFLLIWQFSLKKWQHQFN